MRGREVAWRLFANEFNASSLIERSEDDLSPSYLISPLGARVNRIFLVGVLTELRKKGGDTDPLWRIRVADPTGTFRMNAGTYQPDVVQLLPDFRVPSFVAVIGKVRPFVTPEGNMIPMIRPETIVPVDRSTRDNWLLETAEFTLDRWELANECYSMTSVTRENLVSLGSPEPLIDGLLLAREHYEPDLVTHREIVISLLEDIIHGEYTGSALEIPPNEEEEKEEKSEPEPGVIVLGTIKENEDEDDGITETRLRELLGGKIVSQELDEILETLLDTGEIYTPSEGIFRSI